MTRKRFKKLMMAKGMSRNDAEDYCRIVKFLNSHPKLTEELAQEMGLTKRKEPPQ